MLDQFLFAVKLSGQPRFDAMLGDLATCVLQRVGYDPPAIADILASLRAALEDGARQGQHDCDVQFRAEAGKLVMVLTYAGGRKWSVATALPD